MADTRTVNEWAWRKKPVQIEAYQFSNRLGSPRPEWIIEAEKGGVVKFHQPGVLPSYLIIKTLEGDMRAELGDWIIKGVKGELYPCKPDIFDATYVRNGHSEEGMHTALRKMAEAASQGPWYDTNGAVWIDTRAQVCCGRGYEECCGNPDVEGGQEQLADSNPTDADQHSEGFEVEARRDAQEDRAARRRRPRRAMNPLTEIISKLEKATGPDRELDLEIAKLAGGHDWLDLRWAELGTIRFTRSVDAAITLVPDGDPWTLGQNIHHRHWLACVNEYGPDQEVRSRGTGTHSTSAAIALCIAALRSRGEQ